MNAIEIQGLTKRYGPITAVDGLDLTVRQGELFALLGVNGAGKTTTIKMLSCLTRPDDGDARLLGRSVVTDTAAVKNCIGVSPQETAVAPNLTARENLLLMCGVHGLPRQESLARVEELARTLGLEPVLARRAGKLSGGWQRRLSIAMALVARPEILFLDEPTLGLDVLARAELWDVIRALKGRITVILTTHYMEEAEALSDRVGVMKDGRLLALGAPEELKALCEAGLTRAMRLIQIRNGDILAADRQMIANHAKHILFNQSERHMIGERDQSRFVQHFLHFFRGMSIKAREFNAVIAERLELLERAQQILARFFARGIHLITDERLFHDSLSLFNRLSVFNSGDHIDALYVALRKRERRFHKRVHNRLRHDRSDQARAEREHIRVVVLAGQLRAYGFGAQRAANAFYFICRKRHADAGSADHNAQITFAVRHRVRGTGGIDRVIGIGFILRAEIYDRMTFFLEMRLDVVFHLNGAVIICNGNFHRNFSLSSFKS